jgi:hypothetical protein
MKVAILGESPADEEAILILVESVYGSPVERVAGPPTLSRGWPAVLNFVPSFVSHLWYRTDVEAFVVIVDSDDSPVHQSAHDAPGAEDNECRLCRLRRAIVTAMARLSARPITIPFQYALGLAVPAIEAWYVCGIDPHVNEAAWIRTRGSRTVPYTRRSLKQDVYGTERPSLEQETEHATKAAMRLATDITLLETSFPNGFGPFARDVRDWK